MSSTSTMPSLTSQKTTDNGTGIDESTKVAAAAAAASRQGTVFHTLVASHENHHLIQLNKESRYVLIPHQIHRKHRADGTFSNLSPIPIIDFLEFSLWNGKFRNSFLLESNIFPWIKLVTHN